MNFAAIKKHLKAGGIIAYPTETVWGLGVDPTNAKAMSDLIELKGRDAAKGISILVSDIYQAKDLANIDSAAEKVLNIFWPGPVTFVLPAKSGKDFVGLRCSNHPFVRELMRGINMPITTTSANRAGSSPALTKSELSWLPKSVLIVENEKPMPSSGKGSTVVKIDGNKLECLREGEIDFAWIKNCMQC